MSFKFVLNSISPPKALEDGCQLVGIQRNKTVLQLMTFILSLMVKHHVRRLFRVHMKANVTRRDPFLPTRRAFL